MDSSEELLSEIRDGLRKDVLKQVTKSFNSHDSEDWYRDTRFQVIVNTQGARLDFSLWIRVKPKERQEVFDIMKEHLNKQYGFNLINQRLYTYRVKMEFDNPEQRVNPLETYTLLKINQII